MDFAQSRGNVRAVNGLVLINLGTPQAPTPSAVRRYLREFLSDPRVIDINPVGRALLLNLIILPLRPRRSAHAYQQVWTERGSPLLFHSLDVTERVAAELGEEWCVRLAMRYGQPSIADALTDMRAADVRRLVVLPLFPQAAPSSSGTAAARTMELATAGWDVPSLSLVPEFYDEPGFLDAFAGVAARALAAVPPVDHVLYSFHGVPERHVRKTDRHQTCLTTTCCDAITTTNRSCYRAQCYATARALADRMQPPAWSVAFQSRLGRTPWIQPFTDEVLVELVGRGVRHLAVMCPAFVADCLETLEEIGLRARADFLAAGGTELTLIPSLNSDPAWARVLAGLARKHA